MVITGSVIAPLIMVGYEAPATMAEETINGAKAAPSAMISSVLLSGIASFMLLVSMLYACRENVDSILAGPTMQPSINLFAFVFTNGSQDEGIANS